jgi:APA family basic amino acid/polyamine antiporter
MTWILGIAASLLAGFASMEDTTGLTNIGILLAFVVVCIAVIALRYRKPNLPRSFRCPGMPIVPIIGIGFSLYLVTELGPETWFRFGIWFVVGLIIYLTYGRKRSLLAQSKDLQPSSSAPAKHRKPLQ